MSSSNTKYLSRTDPLELLRSTLLNNKKPKQKDKYLYFDKDIKIPLKTPTAWLSPLTNKQYNLGSLWCYLQYKQNSEYYQKVTELDLDYVSVADKEQIDKYFTGKIHETKFISQQLKMELLAKNAKRDQPDGGFTQGQNQIRKKQNNLPWDLRVIDYVLKYERPTGSKTRSLRCTTQTFNFFLDLLREKQEQTTIPQGKTRLNRIYEKKKLPIIIVPEGIQAGNISLSNIEKFLIHGKYEEPKPLSNTLQRKIQIETTMRNKKVCFEVTSNPNILSLSDWQNVVSVFILGQKSQFSKWAIRDPLQLFKKTKGFLLKYSDITARYDSNDWNIKTFIIDRNARYRDQEMRKKVWNQIEEFLFQKIS